MYLGPAEKLFFLPQSSQRFTQSSQKVKKY